MSRLTTVSIVAITLSFLTAPLMAGGYPRLCLPIDVLRVTSAGDDFEFPVDSLREQLQRWYGHDRVKLQQDEGQWYAILTLTDDISLRELSVVLKGSPFFVPKERLALFGMVILDLQVDPAATAGLLDDFDELAGVSVEQSERTTGPLHVTLEMPYRITHDVFGEPRAAKTVDGKPNPKGSSLPTYLALEDVATRHNAKIHDVRWTTKYGCRMVGCLSVAAISADGERAALAASDRLDGGKK